MFRKLVTKSYSITSTDGVPGASLSEMAYWDVQVEYTLLGTFAYVKRIGRYYGKAVPAHIAKSLKD